MPLVGLIDPSYHERRRDKPGRPPRWLSLDELLSRASESDPGWSPWTFEMVQAVVREHYEPDDRISVTALTGCMRAEVIRRKMDYIDRIDHRYSMLRGSMVHKLLEDYSRLGSIAETWFSTTIDGRRVSCVPDLFDEETIWDFKTTDNPPDFYPRVSHKEQLELERYILNHAESWALGHHNDRIENPSLPFDPRDAHFRHLVAVYLGPKGPKQIEVLHKVKFVTPAGVEKDAREPHVWSDDEVLEEFAPRIATLAEALRIFPEWPDGAEKLWGGLPGWKCPGPPVCWLPGCLASRYPDGLVWDNEEGA